MMDDAYGYSISKDYYKAYDQSISISAVHTVLKRLESKGFIKSQLGGSSNVRGGRKKRIFKITDLGMSTLELIQGNRMKLWEMMPNHNFSYVSY